MKQEVILKLITGVNKVIRESKEILKESGTNFIEKSVLKGKYVSREEHEQLKQAMFKMQDELNLFKERK